MTAAKQKSGQLAPRGFLRRHGWVIAGLVLILAFNWTIRLRLAATPLERDEGEYAYAGQLLLQGIPPYQLAYNMKFPGAYFAYAALMAAFGESTRGIHAGLALVTSLTAVLVFFLGSKLFGRAGGLLAAAGQVLLSASPAAFGLAGHATHFVALFATAGALALLWANEKPTTGRWTLAGLMFGLAVLMKQHAMAIAGCAMLWLGWWNWQKREKFPFKQAWKLWGAFASGFTVVLLLTGMVLVVAGVGRQFLFWTLRYATQYASAASIRTAWQSFLNGFLPVFDSAWPLWVLGAIGLAVCLFQQRSLRTGVVLVLFLGGMLATIPGFHFRGHYFLAALPGVALLVAAAGAAALKQVTEIPARSVVVGVFCAAMAVVAWSNRQIWFSASPQQTARLLYSLNPFLESPQVADYLREHTAPDERIAVIGSEPQIYFHAQRKSASGYIYMYALTEPLPLAQRMRDEFAREIEAARPRYIVFVDIITSWVSLSHADTSVLQWWNEFAKHYEVVGAVKLNADQPSDYYWEETQVRQLNLAECHLLVYRRKNAE